MTSHQRSPSSERWNQFCHARSEYLTVLADTVEQGFTRKDTDHPAFCGCIDWHSSVHGAYALLAASRLTRQPRWAEAVDSGLSSERLEAEISSLKNGELDHEIPYGFSWFLKLAIEREQGWGQSDLLPLATEIATKLENWIFFLRAGEVIRHCQQRQYGNLSWALLNLWEWAQWKANHVLIEKLLTFTREWVILLDETLPPSYDQVTDEFFAASLQRTRTILSILPSDESQAWLTAFYQEDCGLEPLSRVSTPHSAGLNFSRAWSFWTLFACTGKEIYREQYMDHIVTHINLPDCWRDDYRKHAHWVPQFGIYAIALSMESSHKTK